MPHEVLDIGFELDCLVKLHEKRLCNVQCCKAFNDVYDSNVVFAS